MGFKFVIIYYSIYLAGLATFLAILSEPLSMKTYFSDNSLLPGLANREFALGTEAEYYLKDLKKLSTSSSLAEDQTVLNFLRRELENFGLEVFQQNFAYRSENVQFNGTNLYSLIRGERSTSSESIALCIPYRSDSLPGVALGITMAKYFSTKNYWAKDVIIIFVDHEEIGASAWLDSYHDVDFKAELTSGARDTGLVYDPLPDKSGPMQASIVMNLRGREFTKLNIKIQGSYGQLPNLDLFNVVVELAARESITPYFHDKSMPFDLSPMEEYLQHYLETAIAFMKNQATMRADGIHGLFLKHSVQSLTLEADEFKSSNRNALVMTSSLLNMGRLLEGIFRTLNNLTERFNRSYYFYIILSLRRFTSIGFYMIAYGITLAPLLFRVIDIYLDGLKTGKTAGLRISILLSLALFTTLLSTFNISSAMMLVTAIVPISILI